MDYNNNPAGNSLGLLPAYRLYANPVYERLVDKLGILLSLETTSPRRDGVSVAMANAKRVKSSCF